MCLKPADRFVAHGDDSKVKLTAGHAFFGHVGADLHRLNNDLRMTSPEAAKNLREENRSDHGWDANADRLVLFAQFLEFRGESVDLGEDRVTALQEALAIRRGDDGSAATMEERDAQLVLQRFDGRCDGRL